MNLPRVVEVLICVDVGGETSDTNVVGVSATAILELAPAAATAAGKGQKNDLEMNVEATCTH